MSPAVLLYATLATLAQVPAMPADVLITGAKIRTSDPQRPLASAMAVREGVIVAIGEEKDVLRWEGMGTKRLALAGKTITPGFIDAHSHFYGYGRFKSQADLVGTKSFDDNFADQKIGEVRIYLARFGTD